MADQHRVRLIIDVPPELRRRVKVAAANQDTSVRRYVAAILDQAVPGSESPVTLQDVQRLREVRARIMRGRRFEEMTRRRSCARNVSDGAAGRPAERAARAAQAPATSADNACTHCRKTRAWSGRRVKISTASSSW